MGLFIEKCINLEFNSNTYIIRNSINSSNVYLVDIGTEQALELCVKLNLNIKGLFLTHDHYDHILGLKQLINLFPDCEIYCSQYTKSALLDSKVNLSFYHNNPVEYLGGNCKVVCNGDRVNLFTTEYMEVIETPGHNIGCLSFKLDGVLFTGDALIPNIPIVTKLKGGNKITAKESVFKIKKVLSLNDIVYPGHGERVIANQIDWDFYK